VTHGGSDCDVLIIGAGPAGAAAAQLLASWGRSVIVIHRPTASRHSLAESLPSSTRKLLHLLGQLERVEGAHLYPNTGNVALWGGASRTTTSREPGFHVSRSVFDEILRDSARAAGARAIEGRVLGIDGDDPLCVTCAASGDPTARTAYRARYVLDCSGRAGVVARRGWRRNENVLRTLAIVGEWECGAWPASERTQTTVESYRDGWAWSVPLSDTRRQCTVMVDGDRSPEPLALAAKYRVELAKAPALSARLRDARPVSRPWTCDASTYDCAAAAAGRVLLVGDAASFIDPISSAGVKKALLSAWRAAIVVNTCLDDASMSAAACDLHVRREREVFGDCARRSSIFFGEAGAAYHTAFWIARANACGAAAGDGDPGVDGDLARDSELHAAFDQLRNSGAVRFRTASTLRFEPAATIEGRRIVIRDAIVVPGRGAPVQFAAGINLPALARLAANGCEVPALIAAYQDQVGPAPIGGVLTGLSWLVARHALVAEESTV
jgi:flavin-dependent dehydrogenase